MHFAKSKLLNIQKFKLASDELLNKNKSPITLYKSTIKEAQQQLKEHQNQGISTADLITNYTWMIAVSYTHLTLPTTPYV